MKNECFKSLTLSFALGILTFNALSCYNDPKPDNTPTPKVESTTYLEFRGEQVKIPMGFPVALLTQSPEEFELYCAQILQPKNARGEGFNLSYHMLGDLISKHKQKYPIIESNMELADSTYKRILQDIPNIGTKQQTLDKISIVYDFYNVLLKNDILSELEIGRFDIGRGRTQGGSPGTMTDAESLVLLGNPGYAQHYIAAAQDVSNLETPIFGTNLDDQKNNAWKHASWNALTIRYILKGSPASENQAIDFTQDGTSAHEKELTGNNQIHNIKSAMDLHNNMSARVWMEKETKWGIGPFRKMPSFDDIVNEMFNKANSGAFYNSTADPVGSYNAIINAHGGDNSTTWNNLYNNLYGSYTHLVYIK